MTGLSRDDSSTIGFVLACLFGEALTVEELRTWADHIVLNSPEYPPYILELCQFDGFLKDVYDIIGFAPSRDLSKSDYEAIEGIAFLRGVEPFESKLDKSEAIKALKKSPKILNEFKETFRFISLPPV